MHLRVTALCVLLSGSIHVGVLAAEESPAQSLTLARELYAAAEYEHALGVLDGMKGSVPASTADAASVEQYRAFCLMALGRASEAEQAMATLVSSDPTFVPDDAAMSPRLRTTFRSVRARTLPIAIQRQYDAAKAAFDRREFAVASVGFAGVLRLMDDADVKPATAVPPLSDIRTLASGFRDLSISASAPPAAPPVAAPPPVAVVAAPAVFTGDDPDVIPPYAERQVLPPFPVDLVVANRGLLEVVIDERGQVESAVMKVTINPRYDRQAVDAARTWRYRPATRAGVPVKYRKTIQIAVKKPDPR